MLQNREAKTVALVPLNSSGTNPQLSNSKKEKEEDKESYL